VYLRISIIDRKPKRREGIKSVQGLLEIDDFRELLYMPLDLWSAQDYERQWQEGWERLRTHDKSCFVVTIHDPKISPFVEWWLLYKENNKVYVQNQMIFGEIYKNQIGDKDFNINSCYDFIPPRHIEGDYPVSEWVIDYP